MLPLILNEIKQDDRTISGRFQEMRFGADACVCFLHLKAVWIAGWCTAESGCTSRTGADKDIWAEGLISEPNCMGLCEAAWAEGPVLGCSGLSASLQCYPVLPAHMEYYRAVV